jgi:hypothetical protein
MGTCQQGRIHGSAHHEPAVSEAALRTCDRLLANMTGMVKTHAYRDGGLICEDRTSPARPRVWRIAADGALLPDSSYSFRHQAFVLAPLPAISVRLSHRLRSPRRETNRTLERS